MPSPFPGMDPYLEKPDLWPQCHTALIYNIHAQLNSKLSPRYEASMDTHVCLLEPDTEARRVEAQPDVFFVSTSNAAASVAVQARKTTAPTEIILPVEPRTGHRYLAIRDTSNHRVVTAIEILSPSNKMAGRDRDAYLAKRDEYFLAHVNLVEIDLLRSGLRPPLGEHAPAPFAYYVMVSRACELPKAGFWPIGVRDPLPEVPVPLDANDSDCPFDLRACLDKGYEDGRWARKANYELPLDPPLAAPDASWAREVLADRSILS